MAIDIHDCFHPSDKAEMVYRVIGVRSSSGGKSWHVLLVAETPEQGALAVPLDILTDRRYWVPVR